MHNNISYTQGIDVKFKDLTIKSIRKIKDYAGFWLLSSDFDLELSVNHKFDIEMAGFNRYIAEYAITYAVLLDDKDLLKDLLQNGANLDIHDSWNSNKSPIEIAVEYGRASIVKMLLKYGAIIPENITIPLVSPCFLEHFFGLWQKRLVDVRLIIP